MGRRRTGGNKNVFTKNCELLPRSLSQWIITFCYSYVAQSYGNSQETEQLSRVLYWSCSTIFKFTIFFWNYKSCVLRVCLAMHRFLEVLNLTMRSMIFKQGDKSTWCANHSALIYQWMFLPHLKIFPKNLQQITKRLIMLIWSICVL